MNASPVYISIFQCAVPSENRWKMGVMFHLPVTPIVTSVNECLASYTNPVFSARFQVGIAGKYRVIFHLPARDAGR